MTNLMNIMSRFVYMRVRKGLVHVFSFALFHLLLLGCQSNPTSSACFTCGSHYCRGLVKESY